MNTAAQINRNFAGFPQLATAQRKVKNPHLAQIYIRTGQGKRGPWVALGINDTEYIVGFK